MTSCSDGSESASFKYDPFGRRIEATVNGQTTYYLYGASDGGHPIAENAGGGWYREVIMDGVRWGWLYRNGDVRFTLPDALGSTAVLAQDGTVQASRPYSFGEEAQATGAEYKWTNQIRDANGLDHFAFRTYSSNLARWLSPDPADLAAVNPADPASWNRYAYVENTPLAGIDALGLQAGNCGEHCIVTAPPPDPEAPFINPENPLYQLWWDSQSQLAEALGIGDFSKPPAAKPAAQPKSDTKAPQSKKVTASCLAAALIRGFVGDEGHAGVTLTVNLAAAITLRIVKQTAPGDLLPGPGWVYVGVAVLWDAGTVAKSYIDCRDGGPSAQ